MMKKFTLFVAVALIIGLAGNSVFGQALNGTYTIGTTGNYTTFTAAKNALTSYGVSGPVTFNVQPGTYNDYLNFTSAISGASATNRITFNGAGVSSTKITTNATYNTIAIASCSYLTFKNMTIENTNGSYGYTVRIGSSATYNFFQNCNIITQKSSSSSFIPIVFSTSSTSYSSGPTNANFNEFTGCNIIGGYFAVTMYASNYGTIYMDGNKFIGNNIYDFYYYGFYIYYGVNNTLIQYNTIGYSTYTSAGYSIYSYYAGKIIIDGNIFKPTYYCIYLYYNNYSGYTYNAAWGSEITNNIISGFSYASYHAAIRVYYSYYTKIYHNSVNSMGSSSSTTSSCLYLYYCYYVDVKNNFFRIGNYSYFTYLYYCYYGSMNYNNWINNGSGNGFYIDGSYYSNFAGFQSHYNASYFGTHDQNSWDTRNPYFLDQVDLHIAPPLGSETFAPVLSGVTKDVDGQPRATTGTTFVGADVPQDVDLDVTAVTPIVAKLGNNTVGATLRNKGRYALTSQTVSLAYSVDGGAWNTENFTITLSPGQSTNLTFSTPWNITVDKAYNLCVKIDTVLAGDPDATDQICQGVSIGMSGNYTISQSGSGHFTTFNQAVSAMQTRGVSGPINFFVQPGTYNERVVIPVITGVSATSPVKFKGVNKNTVILSFTGTTNTNSATINLNGADYYTFEDMTILSNHSTYAIGIYLGNAADNNYFKNLIITVPNGTSTYLVGIMVSGSEGSYSSSGNNGNYNTWENCVINGGYYGATFYGLSSNNWIVGNKLERCTFNNQHYYGVYSYYQRNFNLLRNRINMNTPNICNMSAYGVYTYYNYNSTYDGNIIKAGTYGMYIYYDNYYSYAQSGDSTRVYNNIVDALQNTTNQTGIAIYYYAVNLLVYNNTIRVTGSISGNYSYAALLIYYPYTGAQIYNNILISTNKNLAFAIYPYPSTGYEPKIDYNDYIFPDDPSVPYFYSYGTYYYTYAAYRAATTYMLPTHDAHSMVNVDPRFVSATDLHITHLFPPIPGTYVGLTSDVDGDVRCVFEPNLGADESKFPRAKPTAYFASEDTMCWETTVSFMNIANPGESKYHWWYLNGQFMTNNLHFHHAFPKVSGLDTIMLVTANCGGRDTFTKIVYVDAPLKAPIADFVSEANFVEQYLPVNFYDVSANCPTGWEWSIDPPMINHPQLGYMPTYSHILPSHPNAQNAYISFDFPGKYGVCLKVWNDLGADSVCKPNYMVVKPSQWLCQWVAPDVEKSLFGYLYDDGGPYSNYSNNLNPPCGMKLDPCAKELTFELKDFNLNTGDFLRIYEGTSNQGRRLWNVTAYGANGMTGNTTNPNYQSIFHSTNGTLYFEMQSDASGNASGFSGEWYGVPGTFPAPIALFDCPDTVCIDKTIYFQDRSTGNGLQYYWDFDMDGVADDFTSTPNYQFSFAGVDTVTLTVTDCGGSATYKKAVIVISPIVAPVPDFDADNLKPNMAQDVVTFRDLSIGCVNSWEWSISPDSFINNLNQKVPTYTFIGNSNKFSQNPQIRFETDGYFSITLKAGFNGNTASTTKTNYIYVLKYCKPTVSYLNPDLGISRVTLGTINYMSSIGVLGYSDFTALASTYLDIQAPYTLEVARNTTYNAMDRVAWIDWNIDGDFDDPGEEIGVETNAQSLVWQVNFTVPTTAIKGYTRLRIAATLSGYTNKACGNRLYGEVEDYRVIIRDDGTPPVIALIGSDTVFLPQCYPYASYVDDGATAVDAIAGPITPTKNDNINTAVPGNYYVRYEAIDPSGNKAVKDRIIVVEPDNVPPVFSLLGNLSDTVDVFTAYIDPGYTASDTCAGMDKVTVTGTVNQNVIGTYVLNYRACDLSLTPNCVELKRTVYVVDRTMPVIVLNGTSPVELEVHSNYVEEGATVTDNYCTGLTAQISGSVDIHVLGTYTITYTAYDCNGNGPVSVQREVNVVDKTNPVLSNLDYNNNDTITIEVNTYFQRPRMTILDNYDKNPAVTESGQFVTLFADYLAKDLGFFDITYEIADASGNKTSITYVIHVVDTKKPVITLVGKQVENICRYDTLEADVATVTDNYDKNLSITRGGTYISDYLPYRYFGMFYITYDATDNSGNKADQVIRYVNVNDCMRSVAEVKLDDVVKVYPNPTSGEFTVDIELPKVQNVTLTVSNALGEVIRHINLENTGTLKQTIDLSKCSSGIYMVNVTTETGSVVRRVMLSR